MSHVRLRGAALALALAGILAFWPGALDRWVLPKVLLVGVAALLALAAPAAGRLPRWLMIAVGGGIALLVIAALAGGQPLAALLGRWPRFEGLVTGGGYLLALWLGARLLGPGSGDLEARLLDRILAVVAGVLGLWSVLEAVGLRPLPSDLARPGALLGNATDQGAVGAILLVVLIARLMFSTETRTDSVILGGAAAAAATSIVLSGSRAALLAAVLGIVGATLLGSIRARRRTALGIGAAGLLLVAAILAPTMGPRLLGLSPLAGETIGGRLLIWQEALAVAARHPLLGVGPSGFLDAVAAEHDVRWFASAADGSVLDSPHDLLLQALVIAGPLGAAGLLAVLVLAGVAIRRRARDADAGRLALLVPAVLGAAVGLIVLLTHVTAPALVVPTALFAGAAVAVPAHPSPTPRTIRVATALAVSAWTAITAAALVGETALGSGVAAAGQGRVVAATQAFEAAAALRPWDPATVLIAAESLTARADGGDAAALPAASAWGERALAADPASLAAGQAVVTNAIAGGDLDRASAVLDALLATYPRDPGVAARAGAVALARGDDVRAERLLLDATALDPDRATPWLTLVYLYQQRGDAQAAADAQAHADALG